MTNRFNAFVVAVETDIREDDAQSLMAAIRQMRGVVAVDGNVPHINGFVERARLLHQLAPKLMELLNSEWAKP